jgi:hypothetical protein
MLRREGRPVNGKRVRRLMAEMDLQGKAPARRRTTDSRHDFPRYPNLVEGLEATRPDQIWVADITYVRLREEFVYLAVLMDVFTRRVRGWKLGRSLGPGAHPGGPEASDAARPPARGPPLRLGGAVRGHRLHRPAGRPGRGDQHGGRRQAGGERVRRAPDADDPGGGDRPVRVPGLRRCVRPARSVPGRRVQPEADPLVAGLPDPGRVRAAMAQGAEKSWPCNNKGTSGA